MPGSLLALLRSAQELLSAMTDSTGRKAVRDDDRAVMRSASGDQLAEHLQGDDEEQDELVSARIVLRAPITTIQLLEQRLHRHSPRTRLACPTGKPHQMPPDRGTVP